MIGKKSLAGLLIVGVMASSVSTSAFARGGGGDGFGIVAGVLGAVAVGSIIANSAPRPVYYDAPPPQQYYYGPPQPVYYQPPPRYYQPPPVYVDQYGNYYSR